MRYSHGQNISAHLYPKNPRIRKNSNWSVDIVKSARKSPNVTDPITSVGEDINCMSAQSPIRVTKLTHSPTLP